jgi:hypothetical protein
MRMLGEAIEIRLEALPELVRLILRQHDAVKSTDLEWTVNGTRRAFAAISKIVANPLSERLVTPRELPRLEQILPAIGAG